MSDGPIDPSEPVNSNLRSAHVLAGLAPFRARVQVAAVKAAVDVAAEADTVANHAKRVQLANQVLMSPARWGEIMAESVAVNGTILAQAMADQVVPDGDIEFVVASLWDAYAGSD